MLKKIVSGGQDGADLAGLVTAKKWGVAVGGFIPKGFLTISGPKPQYENLYGLKETKSDQYPPRTFANANQAHGTLRFAQDWTTRGEKLTEHANGSKPLRDIDFNDPQYTPEQIANWIIENELEVLNIAGNTPKNCPGIYNFTVSFLEKVLSTLKERDQLLALTQAHPDQILLDFTTQIEVGNGSDLKTTCRLPNHIKNKLAQGPIIFEKPFPDKPLSPDQQQGFDEIIKWIVHPEDDYRLFAVGGYAGTGKSLLLVHVREFLKNLNLPTCYGAYTGKATSVLRKRGVTEAGTIHSHLYQRDPTARQGEAKFVKVKNFGYNLFVIDEASMMNQEALTDLLSFKHLRILAFGDHGQLKPVGNDPNVMENPDVRLETPHRQAMDSNILKLAYYLRSGKTPPPGKWPNLRVGTIQDFWEDIHQYQDYQILSGYNNTRHQVNKTIRNIKGFFGTTPDPGEKIIILNNRAELGLFNGMILIVEKARLEGKFIYLDLYDPDQGEHFTEVKTLKEQYGRNKMEWSALPMGDTKVVLADYAYCITVHKSQGSEWEKGVLLEECHPDWELARFAYTGTTRFIQDFAYFR